MDRREHAHLRPQQQRWLRCNAKLWIRPDAAKFLKPGTDPADVNPALRLKRDEEQWKHDREIASFLEDERELLAAMRAELDQVKLELVGRRTSHRGESKYSPNQPCVPAGSGRESGRWGDGARGSATLAQPMGNADTGDAGGEIGSFGLLKSRRPKAQRTAINLRRMIPEAVCPSICLKNVTLAATRSNGTSGEATSRFCMRFVRRNATAEITDSQKVFAPVRSRLCNPPISS